VETPLVVIVVVAAVLLGALLPVILALRSTLRRADELLATAGRDTDRVMLDLTRTLAQLRLASDAGARAQRQPEPPPSNAMDTAASTAVATVGTVLAPALLAAGRAFVTRMWSDEPDARPLEHHDHLPT
jgi:hypothetical protein